MIAKIAAAALSAAAFVGIATSPTVHAASANNAAETLYWPRVCATLDDEPTIERVFQLGAALIGDENLSQEDAGRVIGSSVSDHCPQYIPLLRQYVGAQQRGLR